MYGKITFRFLKFALQQQIWTIKKIKARAYALIKYVYSNEYTFPFMLIYVFDNILFTLISADELIQMYKLF